MYFAKFRVCPKHANFFKNIFRTYFKNKGPHLLTSFCLQIYLIPCKKKLDKIYFKGWNTWEKLVRETPVKCQWNAFETSMKRLWKAGEKFVKCLWSTSETSGEAMVRQWWYNGETMVKQWWNNGETMVRQWWNNGERWDTGETLVYEKNFDHISKIFQPSQFSGKFEIFFFLTWNSHSSVIS